MIFLLRTALGWMVRHLLVFLLIVFALVAAAKVHESYRAVPELERQVAALEQQRQALEANAAQQIASGRASAARIDRLEPARLQRRLTEVRAPIERSKQERSSQAGLAPTLYGGTQLRSRAGLERVSAFSSYTRKKARLSLGLR